MWRRWEFLTAVSVRKQSPISGAISAKEKNGEEDGECLHSRARKEKTEIFQKVQRINLT